MLRGVSKTTKGRRRSPNVFDTQQVRAHLVFDRAGD
ncbi:MAG: hypothetical protein ACI9X4_001731, partial [Glaciecola sp.]